MTHVFLSQLVMLLFPLGGAVLYPLVSFDKSNEKDLPIETRRQIFVYYKQCVQRHLYVRSNLSTLLPRLGNKNKKYSKDKKNKKYLTDKKMKYEIVFLSKNPPFTMRLELLYETFPSCRVACLLRDPIQSVPSMISYIAQAWEMSSSPKPVHCAPHTPHTPQTPRTGLQSKNNDTILKSKDKTEKVEIILNLNKNDDSNNNNNNNDSDISDNKNKINDKERRTRTNNNHNNNNNNNDKDDNNDNKMIKTVNRIENKVEKKKTCRRYPKADDLLGFCVAHYTYPLGNLYHSHSLHPLPTLSPPLPPPPPPPPYLQTDSNSLLILCTIHFNVIPTLTTRIRLVSYSLSYAQNRLSRALKITFSASCSIHIVPNTVPENALFTLISLHFYFRLFLFPFIPFRIFPEDGEDGGSVGICRIF